MFAIYPAVTARSLLVLKWLYIIFVWICLWPRLTGSNQFKNRQKIKKQKDFSKYIIIQIPVFDCNSRGRHLWFSHFCTLHLLVLWISPCGQLLISQDHLPEPWKQQKKTHLPNKTQRATDITTLHKTLLCSLQPRPAISDRSERPYGVNEWCEDYSRLWFLMKLWCYSL